MMEGRQRTGFRGHNEQLSLDERRKRKRLKGGLVLASVWLGAAALGTAWAGWLNAPTAARAESVGARIPCERASHSASPAADLIVWWTGTRSRLQGEKIRIADIDAPETHPPRCPSEQQLGKRATLRLQQLLDAGAVSLEPIDRDHGSASGRKLRIVLVNGKSVGDTLVNEGLARWYAGGRRPWC